MRGQAVKMPTVARNVRYSQSMLDVHPMGISDGIARLINALLVEVMRERLEVDWTTLKVTTKKLGSSTQWETVVSVEEREKK